MARKTKEVVLEEILEPIENILPKKSIKIPKIFYFRVEGCVDEEGTELMYSCPTLSQSFDCEWDEVSLTERAALRFYLKNSEYKDQKKWPLTFKFYYDPKIKAIHKCIMDLAFAPVLSKYIPEKEEVTDGI